MSIHRSRKEFQHIVLRLLALWLCAAAGVSCAGSPRVDRLRIVADGVENEFEVEIAETDRDKQRGLMFREHLAPNAGMLFIYDTPQHIAMWMKNTLIPLDMLFIDGNGTIVRIARETTPKSLQSIPSGQRVLAVLEIAGGRTQELKIREGSRVLHAAFGY